MLQFDTIRQRQRKREHICRVIVIVFIELLWVGTAQEVERAIVGAEVKHLSDHLPRSLFVVSCFEGEGTA